MGDGIYWRGDLWRGVALWNHCVGVSRAGGDAAGSGLYGSEHSAGWRRVCGEGRSRGAEKEG